jgi:hypothetical protein
MSTIFTTLHENKLGKSCIYISVTNLLTLTDCLFRYEYIHNLKLCYGCLLFMKIFSLMFQTDLKW